MDSKLIELDEGLLVEVEVSADQAQQIASSHADKVEKSFDQINSIMELVAQSLATNWQKLNEHATIEKATIELGLGFEAEGNLFVTKAKSSANLIISLELKSKTTKQTTD